MNKINMTELEIIDTAVKIGLGAMISGVFTYIVQKSNMSATIQKEHREIQEKC